MTSVATTDQILADTQNWLPNVPLLDLSEKRWYEVFRINGNRLSKKIYFAIGASLYQKFFFNYNSTFGLYSEVNIQSASTWPKYMTSMFFSHISIRNSLISFCARNSVMLKSVIKLILTVFSAKISIHWVSNGFQTAYGEILSFICVLLCDFGVNCYQNLCRHHCQCHCFFCVFLRMILITRITWALSVLLLIHILWKASAI